MKDIVLKTSYNDKEQKTSKTNKRKYYFTQ